MLGPFAGLQVIPSSGGSSYGCDLEGSSLSGYSTISGNGGLFTVTSTPYGSGVDCAAQLAGAIAIVRKAVTPRAVQTLTLKFQVTASNADDAAAFALFDAVGTGGVISFLPRREASFDSLRRAQLAIRQTSASSTTTTVIGSTGVAVGEWYQFDLTLVGATLSYIITKLSDASIFASGTVAGSWSPISVRDAQYSADAGNLTCPTQYAAIQYCGFGGTTAVPAPAPPPMPQPPAPSPIAFAALSRASLTCFVGVALGSTTLATITCSDAAMTIAVQDPVPGLTYSFVGNVLSVSGTPTSPGGIHRSVISYIASDGSYQVRGSTTHTILAADAAVLFNAGTCANYAGQVGTPVSLLLCSPSIAADVNVSISANVVMPGLDLSFVWNRTASLSSGTLTLSGTPTEAMSVSLEVTYRTGGVVLGTSLHLIIVTPRYVAPSPPPPPAPAPPAPTPTAPPTPTPAPSPGVGPDPLRSSVRSLHRFNEVSATDLLGSTIYFFAAEIGPPFLGNSAVATGAVGNGALLIDAVGVGNFVDGLDGSSGDFTAECMVDLPPDGWTALTQPGAAERVMPVMSYSFGDSYGDASPYGRLAWVLGFCSVYSVADGAMFVYPLFWAAPGPGTNGFSLIGSRVPHRPGRPVHLCFGAVKVGADYRMALWFDGAQPGRTVVAQPMVAVTSGFLQAGGTCGAVGRFGSVDAPQVVNCNAVVDEWRVGVASRYASYINADGSLPAAARVIPWPNN